MGLPKEDIARIALENGMSKNRLTLLMQGLMDRPALTVPFIERMASKGEMFIQRLRDFQA